MTGPKNIQLLERRFFPKDKIIVREGEEAFIAYIIQSGRVRVFSEAGGRKVEFSILEPGDIFGETALIQDTVRTASVEAVEDCNLIVITRDAFENKLRKSDPTLKAIINMLTERMTRSNAEILKTKGVNIDSFISLLNQLFKDLLEAMPDEDRESFKADSFPALKNIIDIVEKYRDKL